MRPTFDALLVALLLIARVRIDTLAEAAVLPLRFQDMANHPLLGKLLAPEVWQAFGDRYVDGLSLILITVGFGALAFYLLADGLRATLGSRRSWWIKVTLLAVIIGVTVVAPTIKLILLRQASGPASYSHDGGVIQTEATIDFLLAGKNPYVEDYTQTPMAEWGFDEYRTALYHYPYLPWTFVFSAPFRIVGQALLGGYDQRLVYLILYIVMLCLVPGLARREGAAGSPALALIAVLGLNPIMANDVIFGQNDVFVLFWVVLALWLLARPRPRLWLSAFVFGLACASKPTAWFLAPFFALLLLDGAPGGRPASWAGKFKVLVRYGWPALLSFALLLAPYVLWDANALVDDVWRWANGTAAQAYQIWGWGASNLVLALQLVSSRFAYWPFWVPQLLISVPLLVWLMRWQARDNTLAGAAWRYGLFLFVFLFVSRFMNENYLGYVLALWALGYFVAESKTSLV